MADCSYQRSGYKSPPGVSQTAYESSSGEVAAAVPAVYSSATSFAVVPAADPKPGESGAWYVYKCTADGVRDAVYRPPIWIADTPRNGGAAQPTPAQLAEVARRQLRLSSPRIRANPADEQLVGLPTWLWLARGEWKAVSATASVPGVSVTAVARPGSVVWTTGDGNSVTCKGPGTPYGSGAGAKSASPDCGYTYLTSSAGQPQGAFAVSATVHWTVTWSGAGQTGVYPDMTTTSNADFRVAESQALNNNG
ncbi:ATP/GTP-binding protein [Streptomyces sp. NPDC007901]|uniref:ATP/GTP-binding protein n=1 Tax=Streptomyces sp. NPDC007901 TaxID=3364785 RepID=UPI0036EA55DC